ncbi:hypothetical protein P3T35_005038 [Kitasatospora sp. GP30]|uniref:hypothetical protein n=1 Tax=Kitasatospora sp. GP30 TaxID=3035084 RepID=UPI002475DC6E|nr:hypothetical protein [Kitasatospora sp. GP30]MDH6143010.1 hypothetical protein [Kitasatospora sp. GP30]
MSWGGLPLGGVLGGASGSAFGAPTTLWIGTVGMTLSFLPAFLSPLRTMTAPTPHDEGGRDDGPADDRQLSEAR